MAPADVAESDEGKGAAKWINTASAHAAASPLSPRMRSVGSAALPSIQAIRARCKLRSPLVRP